MFLTREFKNYKSTLFINYFKPTLKFLSHEKSKSVHLLRNQNKGTDFFFVYYAWPCLPLLLSTVSWWLVMHVLMIWSASQNQTFSILLCCV